MTDTKLLQSGQTALSTGKYTDAIQLLEAGCETATNPLSQDVLKARIGLVKAYYHTQQVQKAIAICEELAQNPNPKLQAWAKNALQNLPVEASEAPVQERELLEPAEAEMVFKQANQAVRKRQYKEAIDQLETFCDRTNSTYANHYQAKMLLVKAYQQHQNLEQAIALCQELTEVNHNVAQIWARNYLPVLAPEIAQAGEQSNESVEEIKPTKLPKRSLEEFKDFCRQNLMDDLKEVEKTRKQILPPLGFVTIVFVLVLGLILKFTPMLLDNRISSTQERCEAPIEVPMRYSDGTVRPNVKAIDLDQLARSQSRRCRSRIIPRSTENGIKILSLALFGIGASSFLWIAFYTSSTETYGRGFQRNIIEKIINFLDPHQSLVYSRAGNDDVTFSALKQSRLFANIGNSNYLKQDHCVSGKIGQTNLFFSELTFQRELPHGWIGDVYDVICAFGRHGGSILSISTLVFLLLSIVRGAPYCINRIVKGQRIDFEHFRTEIVLNSVSRQPIFKGIFFISDFNKTFRGRTIVVPKTLTSKIKILNQQRGQPIKLEDPEFNKMFSVYSNDQVGARYVLSTSVMQRIVDFRKKANRDLLIALVDSQLYIAVPSEEDLFEPRLFKTMLSFSPMREYFEILQLMMSIVEDLNLNQRIWKT